MNDDCGQRLARLLSYLEADPDNPTLLADATQAAIDAGNLGAAERLAQRLRAIVPSSPSARYFAGLIAMHHADFGLAAAILEPLLLDTDQPAIRFNLAWSRAMLGEKGSSLALLDGRTTDEIAAAAMLKTQLMHEAAQFNDALDFGRRALARHPDDAGLLAAVATLALDLDEIELARTYAQAAGEHPEALAVCGMLHLANGSISSAHALFERSLALRQHNPRAWIGRGLARLTQGDKAQAARDLDRGAEQFGRHAGSWIAAGWGHFVSGDTVTAQTRFEQALAIDGASAEAHGSLAVIDALQGRTEEACDRIAYAHNIDEDCFSAALAQVLIGCRDSGQAMEIVDRAMNTPLVEQGATIAGYMAGLWRPTVH